MARVRARRRAWEMERRMVVSKAGMVILLEHEAKAMMAWGAATRVAAVNSRSYAARAAST